MFKALHDWLNHRKHQEWEFGGQDETSGHEGYWYWHVENCRWCTRTRTVMNSRHCACGYNNGIKE